MEQNKLELNPPEWLSDALLLQAVQQLNNDSSITLSKSCQFRPGTAPGDHYASIIYLTTVHYRSKRNDEGEQSLDLIIKTKYTPEGIMKEILADSKIFDTEIKMYKEVLPALKSVLEKAGVEFEFPRHIYSALEPNVILILEDVSSKGWTPTREYCTTFEDAIPPILSLAKFHAASFYLATTSQYDFSPLRMDYMCKEDGLLCKLFSESFDDFCDAVQTWPECQSFAHKFRQLKGKLQSKLLPIFCPNKRGISYNVLAHADFRENNLLHQRDANGNITKTMLIDFQCCHWGSAAVDIFGLLNMVVSYELKSSRRDDLIYTYYQCFRETLEKLKCPVDSIPSCIDLQVELLRKGFLEVFYNIAIEYLKVMAKNESFVDDLKSGTLKNAGFKDPHFRRFIEKEMPQAMHRGLLD